MEKKKRTLQKKKSDEQNVKGTINKNSMYKRRDKRQPYINEERRKRKRTPDKAETWITTTGA